MVRMQKHLEFIAMSATLCRLFLAVGIVGSLDSPGVCLSLLATLIIADISDGAIARHWGVDSDRRRALDSGVDRLCVHLVLSAAVISTLPSLLGIYSLLLARDVIGSIACTSAYLRRERRVLVIGDGWHKAWSLGSALFLISILLGSPEQSQLVGATLVIVSWALLADYLGILAGVRSGELQPTEPGSCRVDSKNLAGLGYVIRRAKLFYGIPRNVRS